MRVEGYQSFASRHHPAGPAAGCSPEPTTWTSRFFAIQVRFACAAPLFLMSPLDSAVSIGAPSYDSDPSDADWTAEIPASDISEDDAITFGKREMMPHLCTKRAGICRKNWRLPSLAPSGRRSRSERSHPMAEVRRAGVVRTDPRGATHQRAVTRHRVGITRLLQPKCSKPDSEGNRKVTYRFTVLPDQESEAMRRVAEKFGCETNEAV